MKDNAPNAPDAKSLESTVEPSKAVSSDDTSALGAPSRAIRPHGLDEGRVLATAAARVALDNNGQNVMILDVSSQSAEFDFFVLATGTSRRQLHAISEQIDDELEKNLGDQRLGIEGYDESRWIVLDYGSVIIHLFDDETRDYYDLESLWADGEAIALADVGLADGKQGTADA
ncbi:MAG TPA: ribosome silencing factor [Rhodopirellula sp.]|nr:ribosome silencing factor [Rhodopirellula sp.]